MCFQVLQFCSAVLLLCTLREAPLPLTSLNLNDCGILAGRILLWWTPEQCYWSCLPHNSLISYATQNMLYEFLLFVWKLHAFGLLPLIIPHIWNKTSRLCAIHCEFCCRIWGNKFSAVLSSIYSPAGLVDISFYPALLLSWSPFYGSRSRWIYLKFGLDFTE